MLWQLGRFTRSCSERRFLAIYFVTGIGASLTSLLRFLLMHTDGASVGASGAIFGILGALIFSIRRSPRWQNERWARSVVQQLMFWIVVNIVIGYYVPQIDKAAHIGGLLAGVLLGATLPARTADPTVTSRDRRDAQRSNDSARSGRFSQDQPQVLRREQPVVERVNHALQLRRIFRMRGDARSFRELMDRADLLDGKSVLARQHRERGRMPGREVGGIAPEVAGGQAIDSAFGVSIISRPPDRRTRADSRNSANSASTGRCSTTCMASDRAERPVRERREALRDRAERDVEARAREDR